MPREIDLKNIEKKAVLTYFQDGLWDIVLGVLLFAWGFGLLTDTAGFTAIWFVGAFWIVWVVKERIVYPRVGQVKVALERQTLFGLLLIGLITLGFGIVTYLQLVSGVGSSFFEKYFMLIFAAVIATIVAGIALLWRVSRWYLYSLLVILGGLVQQWMSFSLPWSFMIPGLGILLGGTARLIYFLKNNPVIEGS